MIFFRCNVRVRLTARACFARLPLTWHSPASSSRHLDTRQIRVTTRINIFMMMQKLMEKLLRLLAKNYLSIIQLEVMLLKGWILLSDFRLQNLQVLTLLLVYLKNSKIPPPPFNQTTLDFIFRKCTLFARFCLDLFSA